MKKAKQRVHFFSFVFFVSFVVQSFTILDVSFTS